MSKDTEQTKHDAEVAQFRFALIAPVVQGLYPDAPAAAYYKRVTEKPLTLPDGSTVTYSYKTLEKMEIPVHPWRPGCPHAKCPVR